MNATEHLVEVYYRQLGCFTATDIKIPKGNNRQFDLLAFNYTTKKLYHVEISVAHGEHWAGNLNDLKKRIRFKFFGFPRNNRPENSKTDFAKGKTYLNAIKATYLKYGIDYSEVVRVWCTWCLPPEKVTLDDWYQELATEFNLKSENFQLLLFRDTVIPTLLKNIGTANYDDELLRTLSLINQFNIQTANKGR
ncbi:MAG: hypothetical protein ABSD71_07480 [Bacteroidales bacterium]|jgi:hypothetical protein